MRASEVTQPLPVFRSALRAPSGNLPPPHGRHTASSLAVTAVLPVVVRT